MEGIALQRTEPENPDLDCRRLRRRGSVTNPTLILLIAAALIAFGVPTTWWVTDRLEADNDFCNSCHLPSGVALHTEIRDDFNGRPAASLAARHAEIVLPNRPEEGSGVRCIDCHGGVGLVGRAKIKLLSAKDTALYLTGRFHEPEGMGSPLPDADCRQCHPRFETKGEGFDGEAFHDKHRLIDGLSDGCVDCHTVHDATTDPDLWFLRVDHLRTRCASCHVEYAPAGP